MVAHVVLHHVLDAWFVQDVLPWMQGPGLLRRVAEDGILGGAREAEARRSLAVLPTRLPRFRLPVPPEHPALRACKRPPSRNRAAGGTGTLALLGFPH
jgi:hypothetical protein